MSQLNQLTLPPLVIFFDDKIDQFNAFEPFSLIFLHFLGVSPLFGTEKINIKNHFLNGKHIARSNIFINIEYTKNNIIQNTVPKNPSVNCTLEGTKVDSKQQLILIHFNF